MTDQHHRRHAMLLTSDAHALRLCFDLIVTNIKMCMMDLAEDRAIIAFMDSKTSIYVMLFMPAANFREYFVRPGDPVSVSFPSRAMHRLLKGMRKKDFVELAVYDDLLSVKIFPSSKDREIVADVKAHVTKTSSLEQDPTPSAVYNANTPGYVEIDISSLDFTKLLKDLCVSSQIVRINIIKRGSEASRIEFETDTKKLAFGNTVIDKLLAEVAYTAEFDSTSLMSILKITAVSKTINVAAVSGYPLKITTQAGGLGTLYAYVQSIELKIP